MANKKSITRVKGTVTRKQSKKLPVIKTIPTKTEIIAILSERTGLAKVDIKNLLFTALPDLIKQCIGHNTSAGQFTLPALLKIVKVKKPAIKARKGINPFTKEEMVFKAKKAHNVVKIRGLKQLKEVVS